MIKEIPLSELVLNYSNRHGFILQSDKPLDDKTLVEIAEYLEAYNLVRTMPDFITRIDDKFIAFVYPDKVTEPLFFYKGNFTTSNGTYYVAALSTYLRRLANVSPKSTPPPTTNDGGFDLPSFIMMGG